MEIRSTGPGLIFKNQPDSQNGCHIDHRCVWKDAEKECHPLFSIVLRYVKYEHWATDCVLLKKGKFDAESINV
jgi:hypothetical protein